MNRITPQYYQNNSPSRERLDYLKKLVEQQGRTVPDDFDIDEIHWVTDRLGITDFEGSQESVLQDYFTINVAGELNSPAQIQADIDPGSGTVEKELTELAALIHKTLSENSDTKVVVHCAMGMERSPLTVVWYLHTYQNKTLDEAYEMAMSARPVVCDRREWIKQ
jgi:protein-tyrosine phosphatase|tara:strand:- start:8558 stop:9052 length:495 start_codon:yes stop_codon:yes gene_type:complete